MAIKRNIQSISDLDEGVTDLTNAIIDEIQPHISTITINQRGWRVTYEIREQKREGNRVRRRWQRYFNQIDYNEMRLLDEEIRVKFNNKLLLSTTELERYRN